MTNTQNKDFESVLADLLEQRAGDATVVPDLEAILTAEPSPTSEPQPAGTGRRHWLLAAAALLVFVSVGAAVTRNVANKDPEATSAGTPIAAMSAVPESFTTLRQSLQDDELIVWLEPQATAEQVSNLVELLEEGTLATSWIYVNRDQTWAEFTHFWADSPEVLDAVEPEQLPTSFRVTTPNPTGLVSAIDRAAFPFVQSVQGTEINGACHERPSCIETRIDQAIEDLEEQGVTANGSLAILEDRTITDYEADLLRIRLQACIDMMPPDDDGDAFAAGMDNNLNVAPDDGTSQTQLDRFQRCADESVGDLPAIYRLLRARTAAAADPMPSTTTMRIERLGIEVEIVEGTTTRGRVGHYSTTAPIGSGGNAAIAGPRTTYGAPFANLDQLTPGDEINISTADGTFLYIVREQPDSSGHFTVDPNDTNVLDQTGRAMLTLTSTHPEFSNRERIIVQADLQGEPLDTTFTTQQTRLAD